MSKNKNIQSSIEKNCLDFVKINMCEKECFGVSTNHYNDLKKWLNESDSNQKHKFPDFIFKDGFIEHFAVTSSVESKKGANQRMKSEHFKKKSEDGFLEKMNNQKYGKELFSRTFSRPFEEHSLLNIRNSIKKNWNNHIESYNNNDSSFIHRIFLIEYMDMNIHTGITKNGEVQEVFETYRISVDELMLNWIYKYKKEVDYLIFVNQKSSSIEIIRINNIPKLIKDLPEVLYDTTVGFETHSFYNFKI